MLLVAETIISMNKEGYRFSNPSPAVPKLSQNIPDDVVTEGPAFRLCSFHIRNKITGAFSGEIFTLNMHDQQFPARIPLALLCAVIFVLQSSALFNEVGGM